MQLTGYTDLLSAVSAIDEEYGRLFVYLTQGSGNARRGTRLHRGAVSTPAADDDPLPGMNLVGISLSTGAVTSSALACQHFPDCPWNIQYLS